jgi:hypothetical protein
MFRRIGYRANTRRAVTAVVVLGFFGVALPPMIRNVRAQSSSEKPNANGIVGGGLDDRASQGSGPLVQVVPDDSKRQEVLARNASVPGPANAPGPGEVVPVAFKPLPEGSKSAIDAVSGPQGPVGPTIPVVAPDGAPKRRI